MGEYTWNFRLSDSEPLSYLHAIQMCVSKDITRIRQQASVERGKIICPENSKPHKIVFGFLG